MQTFDNEHHAYEGEDFGDCLKYGMAEEAEVHMSLEEFSRSCDEVFGG